MCMGEKGRAILFREDFRYSAARTGWMNRDMAIFRDPMPIIVEIQLRSIGFLNVDYE